MKSSCKKKKKKSTKVVAIAFVAPLHFLIILFCESSFWTGLLQFEHPAHIQTNMTAFNDSDLGSASYWRGYKTSEGGGSVKHSVCCW